MRVAINGMGIAGPTLAYWLRRQGTIRCSSRRRGSSIRRRPRIRFLGIGHEIAERMGIISALRQHGYQMERLRMVDGGRPRGSAHGPGAPVRGATAAVSSAFRGPISRPR